MTRIPLSMLNLHPPVLAGTPRKFHGRFSNGREDDVYSSVCRLLDKHGPCSMSAALCDVGDRMLADPDPQEKGGLLEKADGLAYLARSLQCSALVRDWVEWQEASGDFRSKVQALDAQLDICDATRHALAALLQSIVALTVSCGDTAPDWQQIDLATWIGRETAAPEPVGPSWRRRTISHERTRAVHRRSAELIKRALDCRGQYRDEWFAGATQPADADARTIACLAFRVRPGKYADVWARWQTYDDTLAGYTSQLEKLAGMPRPANIAAQLYFTVYQQIESFADLFCKLIGEADLDTVESIRRHLQAEAPTASDG